MFLFVIIIYFLKMFMYIHITYLEQEIEWCTNIIFKVL